jgi:hypothetical protein
MRGGGIRPDLRSWMEFEHAPGHLVESLVVGLWFAGALAGALVLATAAVVLLTVPSSAPTVFIAVVLGIIGMVLIGGDWMEWLDLEQRRTQPTLSDAEITAHLNDVVETHKRELAGQGRD